MQAPAPAQPFFFHGSGREYFKIWIVNLAFTIATLGIYAAWAKVRTRRYFYQATELNGTRFDYHANPKAILKGNLLMAAIMLTYVVGGAYFPVLAVILMFAVLFLMPLLVVYSLRFHLENSSYSNLRFHFQGRTGSAYARLGIAFLISAGSLLAAFTVMVFTGVLSDLWMGEIPNALGVLMSVLMLFLAFTTIAAAFNRGLRMFIVNNTQFGSAAIHSRATFKQFNWITLKAALIIVPLMIGYVVLATLLAGGLDQLNLPGAIAGASLDGREDATTASASSLGQSLIGLYSVAVGLTAYLLMFALAAYTRTAFDNLVWNHAELEGGHQFESKASPWMAAWINFSNWVLIVLSLGLYLPFARIRSARYRIQHMTFKPAGSVENIVRIQQDRQKAYGESMTDALGLDLGL